MYYAYATTLNPLGLAYHGLRPYFGFFAIEIASDGSVTENLETFNYFEFYTFHGWLAWAAWGFLALVQVISNRYLKMYWKASMWIHRISGMFILIGTFVTGIWAVKETAWNVKN